VLVARVVAERETVLFAGAPAALWINVIIMAGFAAAFIYFYSKK
jgi:hypothetical protein